jgi:Zn-dependent peptidase ImmA (M78 family)
VTSSDDGAVLEATAELVRGAWALVDASAARAPLRSDQITKLLVRTGTRLCEYRFESSAVGMAIPWGANEHAILIDSAAPRADYDFTIRHELAHVLAGEVSDTLFLSAADTMSFSERRADLFAVADLVPAWLVRQLQGGRRPWSHLRLEVQQAFRELTIGWSEERLRDRAQLRVELYRNYEL